MRVVEGHASVEDVDAFVSWLDAVGEEHGAAVQAFDARYVAGERHLSAAVERANRAFERDDAIARDRGVEMLLYAAGRRQIASALEMGLSAGDGPVVVVVDGGDEAGAVAAVRERIDPADVLGTARDEARIREFFGVTEAELAATGAGLEALVVERVALLVIEK